MSKGRGLNAVLVCILRLEEVRERGVEENDRATCWHGRNGQTEVAEANLKTRCEGDARGTKTRCADMMRDVKVSSPRSKCMCMC